MLHWGYTIMRKRIDERKWASLHESIIRFESNETVES